MNRFWAGQNRPLLFLGVLLLGMSVALGALAKKQPTGADALGYVYAGRQLASAHTLKFTDPHNLDSGPYFFLHMYRMVETNSADATFCCLPGLPILFALSLSLTHSSQALNYVVPFLAVAGLAASAWFSWLITKNWWTGLWTAVILSGSLIFWEFSTLPLTDLPSMSFIILGASFFLLSRQQNGRKGLSAALLGGFFIGFALWIRYANAILTIPALIFCSLTVCIGNSNSRYMPEMWFGNWNSRTITLRIIEMVRDGRQWLFWGIVGLFAGGALLYNWYFLGGPFNSVYSTPELGAYPWPLFSWRYAFGPSPVNGYSALAIIKAFWQNFPFLILLAPIGWAAMPRPYRRLSLLIVLTTIGLYAFYAFAPQGNNARFLLPVFPFVAAAIAHAIITMNRRLSPKKWRWLLALLAVVLVWARIPAKVDELQRRNRAGDNVIARVQTIAEALPPDAVFLALKHNDLYALYAGRSVFNYRRILRTNPQTERFDMAQFEACLVQTIDRLHAQNVPVYFVEDDGWNMPALLQTHFELAAALPDQPVQAVLPPKDGSSRALLASCRD